MQESIPETVFPYIRHRALTEDKRKIAEYTRRLAKSLHVIGMINIQFIVCGEDDVYVIEVNPVPAVLYHTSVR